MLIEFILDFIGLDKNCGVNIVLKFENMYLMNNIIFFLLIGVQVLRTVLNKFFVNNRKNMFVVKELVDLDLVYYLRYVKNGQMYVYYRKQQIDGKFFDLVFLFMLLFDYSLCIFYFKYFKYFYLYFIRIIYRNFLEMC